MLVAAISDALPPSVRAGRRWRRVANALLAAIRERVPRLSLSLYIMPPALLFNPNDMDAVTDAVHSSSKLIRLEATPAQHRRGS